MKFLKKPKHGKQRGLINIVLSKKKYMIADFKERIVVIKWFEAWHIRRSCEIDHNKQIIYKNNISIFDLVLI